MAIKADKSSTEVVRQKIGESIELLIEGLPNPKPKPFVFVLMPFQSDFDDIYQLGIKNACISAGAYCERVDEQIFVENILERVYNQIAKADIIISEMTGRNPNVFYETGYAHALSKRVILLTQNANDIPFDLKHYPHIIYNGKIALLKTELEKRIKWCIDNPTKSIEKASLDFEFVINGKTWQEGMEIEIPYKPEISFRDRETDNWIFSLEVGIHNNSNFVIDNSNYHLSLIAPKTLEIGRSSDTDNSVGLNEHSAIIRLRNQRTIFPDDWNSAVVNFIVSKRKQIPSPIEFTLRLFSELGAKDYKFTARLFLQKGG